MKHFLLILSALAMVAGVTVAYAHDHQATDEQIGYSFSSGTSGAGTYDKAEQFEYAPGR